MWLIFKGNYYKEERKKVVSRKKKKNPWITSVLSAGCMNQCLCGKTEKTKIPKKTELSDAIHFLKSCLCFSKQSLKINPTEWGWQKSFISHILLFQLVSSLKQDCVLFYKKRCSTARVMRWYRACISEFLMQTHKFGSVLTLTDRLEAVGGKQTAPSMHCYSNPSSGGRTISQSIIA